MLMLAVTKNPKFYLIMDTRLSPKQEKMLEMAKRDPAYGRKMKKWIASYFHLPTEKHVNLQKSFEYFNYMKHGPGKVERMLDQMDEKRRDDEIWEAKHVNRDLERIGTYE